MIINDSIKLNESVHTVELYKSHTSDPIRKKFNSYNDAMKFAKNNTSNYYEIMITTPGPNGPSVINSWSKEDGWFKESIMNESNQVILKNSNGYEILVANNGAITAVSCFSYYGGPSDYTAETIYKDLYPKKKVDYVDKKNGYVELRMSVDDAVKEVKRICPGYQVYRKD